MNPFYYRTIRYAPPGGTRPAMEPLPIRAVSAQVTEERALENSGVILEEGVREQEPPLKKTSDSADLFFPSPKIPGSEKPITTPFHLNPIWEEKAAPWTEKPRTILAVSHGTDASDPAILASKELGEWSHSPVEILEIHDPHADPAQEILRHAAGSHSSLIVLSTHGRKGKERVLGGSIAEVVVKEAVCDVLVIKNRVDWKKIGRILVPVDGSSADFQEITAAVHWGAVWNAECWLLHVQTKKDPPSDRFQEWGRWMEKLRWENIENLHAEGPQDIASAILEAERAHDIDFIFMGTHRETIHDLLLPSSVCLEVLRESKSPVWVLHPHGR